MAWNDFEHKIWKSLKDCGLEQKKSFFLCVSGGLDSMVLLEVLTRILPNAKLTIAHYHHGPTDDLAQVTYRDQCFNLVENRFKESLSHHKNLHFIVGRCDQSLRSEAQFREARWSFFQKHRSSDQPIITAHHLDDWSETLTLKLIRGVGAEGFTAFKMWDENIVRPFLETPKKELLAYALTRNLKWLEDPSNDSDQYLRNWLRNNWFKSLDEKNPSGYENYSRSLLRLCQELSQNQTLDLCFYRDDFTQGLDRNWYGSLREKQQMKAIALFLRQHRVLNMTQGQIAEIQKRFQDPQKNITFSIGAIKWLLNVNQIMLQFSK